MGPSWPCLEFLAVGGSAVAFVPLQGCVPLHLHSLHRRRRCRRWLLDLAEPLHLEARRRSRWER